MSETTTLLTKQITTCASKEFRILLAEKSGVFTEAFDHAYHQKWVTKATYDNLLLSEMRHIFCGTSFPVLREKICENLRNKKIDIDYLGCLLQEYRETKDLINRGKEWRKEITKKILRVLKKLQQENKILEQSIRQGIENTFCNRECEEILSVLKLF